MISAVLLALAMSAAPTPKDASSGADWPQWRGPNRDGKSAEKGLNFPSAGPPLLWTNDNVGTGYGSPAVVGDRLYIIGGSDNAAGSPEALMCLSLKDGKEIWKKDLGTSAGKFSDRWGGGPRSTPTVVDDHIYVLGGTGDVVCFAKADGAKIWSKNLVRDFGGGIPQWGYSESPLVDDGHVIVSPGKTAGMVALEAKTGKTVWQCKDVTDGAGYSSVMPMILGDKKLYIQQSMKSAFGVFAKDGKLAFKAGGIGRSTAVIPTPVISDDYVFFTAGYSAGFEAFKLSPGTDKVDAKAVFSGKFMSNHHGGVIGVGEHIYGHTDKNWVCMTWKTDKGEVVWEHKDFKKGSISFADGLFYCYQESDGALVAIKATPEKWEEVGRMKIPKTSAKRPGSGKVWPHPVIAQGKLFLRDFELLYAYDLKSAK